MEAVIRREQIWQLCHASSSSSPTICSDDSSDISFPSPVLLPPDPPKHHLSSNSSTFSQPVNKPELHSPASRSTDLPNVFLEIDKELKMRGHHLRKIRTGASTLSIANRCHGIESQQSRSPSVVARLMGLDPLPDSSTSKPEKLSLIRRKISHSRSVAEEIEIGLKMRGFDKQSKDLVALKQILEALQLKGLLQSGVPAVEPKSTKLLTLYGKQL